MTKERKSIFCNSTVEPKNSRNLVCEIDVKEYSKNLRDTDLRPFVISPVFSGSIEIISLKFFTEKLKNFNEKLKFFHNNNFNEFFPNLIEGFMILVAQKCRLTGAWLAAGCA